MADILIRKVSEETKARLAKAAAAEGASLQAFLRGRLDQIARETPRPNDEDQPFGTWAAALFADFEGGDEFAELVETVDDKPAEIPEFPE